MGVRCIELCPAPNTACVAEKRKQRTPAFAGMAALLLLAFGAYAPTSAHADTVPLGTLVDVEGIRENQLTGYGVVVGLNGTGDGSQAKYTSQSLKNMLNQFGVRLPDGPAVRARNTAAVIVSASFPPGYRKGQAIDVTVSSLGDAKSLRGGTLLMTPLRAADGETYALAQGNIVVPGLSASGKGGSAVTVNVPTAGRIPQGATVEREIENETGASPSLHLNLKRPGFEAANQVVLAVNQRFGQGAARAQNATSVWVQAPEGDRVAFMAALWALPVLSAPVAPRVVFNARTGTVVIGQGVTVKPAVISHGTLKVSIRDNLEVSQPNAFAQGRTAVTPNSSVDVEQDKAHTFQWKNGTELQAIVDTINAIGTTPDDLMAILQALDEAGALSAELVVI